MNWVLDNLRGMSVNPASFVMMWMKSSVASLDKNALSMFSLRGMSIATILSRGLKKMSYSSLDSSVLRSVFPYFSQAFWNWMMSSTSYWNVFVVSLSVRSLIHGISLYCCYTWNVPLHALSASCAAACHRV